MFTNKTTVLLILTQDVLAGGDRSTVKEDESRISKWSRCRFS